MRGRKGEKLKKNKKEGRKDQGEGSRNNRKRELERGEVKKEFGIQRRRKNGIQSIQ